MGKFYRAMRPDRTAAVRVGIDHWSEQHCALSCGIKCDTQLGEQAHVRSESSRHNDLVHRWKYLVSGPHNQPLTIAYNLIDSDVLEQLDHAVIQQLANLQAELSALFQLIIRPPRMRSREFPRIAQSTLVCGAS